MIPYLENPPLDGFDLHWVPTKDLPSIAAELKKLARIHRKGWPEYAEKLADRAALLEAQWTMTAQPSARGGR